MRPHAQHGNMLSMTADQSELLRLILNLIRFGTIADINHDTQRVRVKVGENTTTWRPWITLRRRCTDLVSTVPGRTGHRVVALGGFRQCGNPHHLRRRRLRFQTQCAKDHARCSQLKLTSCIWTICDIKHIEAKSAKWKEDLSPAANLMDMTWSSPRKEADIRLTRCRQSGYGGYSSTTQQVTVSSIWRMS